MPSGMANPLAPDVQRDPKNDDGGRDSSHGAVGVLVTGRRHPWIRIEGQEESEKSLEMLDTSRYKSWRSDGAEDKGREMCEEQLFTHI